MNYKHFLTWPYFFTLLAILSGLSSFSLFSQSIRLDEAQQIWVSTKSAQAIVAFIGSDVHVPLYAFLIHFIIQIFGTNIFYPRLLSFIFFLATVAALYYLVRESADEEKAMFSAALFSLSPFIIWYSSEARMYTMFTFAATLNSIFFLRLFKSRGKGEFAGYFLTTLFGLYTHYFFNFLLVAQFCYLVYRFLKVLFEKRREGALWEEAKKESPMYMRFIAIMGAAYLLFLPWIIYVLHLGAAANTQPDIPKPTTYNIFQLFVQFFFGFQNQALQAVFVSFWPLIITILFFIFTNQKKITSFGIDYFIMVTFLPIMMVFGVSLVRPIFLPRYLIFVIPTFFYLISTVVLNYSKRISVIVIIGLFFAMATFLFYQQQSPFTPVKEDYHDVVTCLDSKANPSDVVAVTAPFTIYPVEYYYKGTATLDTIPHWDRYSHGAIPAFSSSGLVAQMASYKKSYTDMYVVFSYDQGYESTIKKYLESHYQRLYEKVFSPGLELREYKLRYDTK